MKNVLVWLMFGTLPLMAWQGEWSGSVSFEGFTFNQEALATEQEDDVASIAFTSEYYVSWDNGDQSFTFVPFLRYDARDDERSHWDIRELTWQKVSRNWELRAGIRKVFWGVTESVHLTDIINQTDLVENSDGEEKLGQPMLNFAWINDWGTLDLFALTGFRERTFPGDEGRLRTVPRVDTDTVRYESSAEERHVDLAVRYSHSLGIWDLGLSHFHGTSREPLFEPGLDNTGMPVLTPYHPIIDQSGLELQATMGGWLLKAESIYRSGFGAQDYLAFVGGFEYTFVNVGGTGLDIGAISEYIYDERNADATTPFERDIFTGARLAFNDAQSLEVLAGAVIDLDGDGTFFNLEAERRLGSEWKASLEMRSFSDTEETDLIHGFRNDDHVRLEISRYF